MPRLFVIRPGRSIPQPLGRRERTSCRSRRRASWRSSPTRPTLSHRLFTGTLARMTMDGAARPWMENVREADWSPDGSTLAVIRVHGAKDRLEYPIGKVLYETRRGYLSDPRVSPDGSESRSSSTSRYDNRGWLRVVDEHGNGQDARWRVLGPRGPGLVGRRRDAVFLLRRAGWFRFLPAGCQRKRSWDRTPGVSSIASLEVMDIAADGRMRVDVGRTGSACGPSYRGDGRTGVPWLDIPLAADMSEDGRWLLFSDEGQSAGLNYAVALRKTDGTPAVRLGEGYAVALSPDSKWAIGYSSQPRSRAIRALPDGPGSDDAARLFAGSCRSQRELAGQRPGLPVRRGTRSTGAVLPEEHLRGTTCAGDPGRHESRVDRTRWANHPGRKCSGTVAAH